MRERERESLRGVGKDAKVESSSYPQVAIISLSIIAESEDELLEVGSPFALKGKEEEGEEDFFFPAANRT